MSYAPRVVPPVASMGPWSAVTNKHTVSDEPSAGVGKKVASNPDEQIKDACRAFESFLMSYMLKTMRASVPKSGLLYGGKTGEVFQDMMDEKVCDAAAKSQGIGLAEMMFRTLRQAGR